MLEEDELNDIQHLEQRVGAIYAAMYVSYCCSYIVVDRHGDSVIWHQRSLGDRCPERMRKLAAATLHQLKPAGRTGRQKIELCVHRRFSSDSVLCTSWNLNEAKRTTDKRLRIFSSFVGTREDTNARDVSAMSSTQSLFQRTSNAPDVTLIRWQSEMSDRLTNHKRGILFVAF